MRIALCSSQISEAAASTLSEHVDRIVYIKPCEKVYQAIAAHPDIQLCPVDSGSAVVHPDMDGDTVEELEHFGVQLITGATRLRPAYPGDIPYNAAVVGKRCFHLKGATDPILLMELEKRRVSLVPVKQGYSKCSTLPLGAQALVSADGSISRAGEKAGLTVERISPGDVLLPGMNYGFIGGAAGVLEEERTVFFNGDLHTHSQGKRMEEFLERQGYGHRSLYPGPLEDVGSIFFLNTKVSCC